MIENKNNKTLFKGLIPTRLSGLIGLIIIAIVAFSLGSFLSGGNSSTNEDMAGHNHSEAESSEPTTWTCSMHPQIQLPNEGKCPLCFMDLIPLESGDGEELDPRQIKMSETAKQIARIETTPAVRGSAEAEIRMVGKLDYDETKVSYITAWFPGRIDSLFVNFTGIAVREGDNMARIYSPEMIAAQEELVQAIKAVNAISSGSQVLQSTAKATVVAARDKLRLFGFSDDQIKEVEIQKEAPDHININSPASGIVVNKNVNEGMYVKTGMRLFTVADLSELWAYFDVYESDLPWIKLNQEVEFTSLAFPGEIFKAEINFIDPILDPRTRTVKVRASVDNGDGLLKPDMFVSGILKSQVSMAGKAANDAEDNKPLLIPVTAPLLTGTRAVVYVEINSDDGSIFEGRVVALGPRAGEYYIVKSGLEEGENVVINGAFKIDAELQIRAKPSMMMPEGGGPAGHNHGQSQVASSDQSGHEGHAEAMPKYEFGSVDRIEVAQDAQGALVPVYDAYFDIQMALADDDLSETINGFKLLLSKVKNVDMSLFKDDAHMRWMKIYKAMIKSSEEGSKTKNIEDSRSAFYLLSLAAIELHDTFGHASNQTYYLTYCPMAFEFKGAFWLQTTDTVNNSFFGESMLRCGEIKQDLAWGNSKDE